MAAVVVALDGTRVNDSTSNTSWSKVNLSGPAPVSEAQLAYQGGATVNVKNTNTGAGNHGGLAYDPGSGAVDMTAATHPLYFAKIYVADFGALRTDDAVRARIGSANNQYYFYVLAGTAANRSVFNAYPAQGGYILGSINPNVAAWREGTVGSPALNAVDYFAGLAVFNTGGAKSENFAVDAIDVGRGLKLTRGDAGSTEGIFQDFITSDQDNTSNRWGVVYSRAGIIFSLGRLTIGESGTATEFFDDGNAIVIFPDGYYGVGDVGVLFDISNAGTIVTMSTSRLRGRGSSTTSDTRPDFTVSGTSGSFDMNGTTLGNFRNITFTSVCNITNSDIECQLLTQASSDLDNSTIRTNAVTSVACLQDPVFGVSTGLHDVEFIQTGSGHALEISSDGSYTLTNITFTGYGADDSDSAAIDVTASSGTVDITVSGGSTPTFKSAGATVNIISGAVSVKVTAKTDAGDPIQSARVHLRASDGTGPFPYQEGVTITRSGTTATVSHTGHGMATNDKVFLSGITDKVEDNGVRQITVTGATSYTYTTTDSGSTSYNGSITSTFVALDGLTDASGEISVSRVYSSNQPVEGWARKSTASPYYKQGPISSTVDSADGLDFTAVMVSDE